MTTWKKLGRVFAPAGQKPWMARYAACPVAMRLSDRRHRIYFGTRDNEDRPRVGSVDIDLADPGSILDISSEPCLDIGAFGMFDENGVYPGSIQEMSGATRMYFSGRCNLPTPRFAMAIGIAESRDGGTTFERTGQAPAFDRHSSAPWAVTTPCVIATESGYRMWYTAGLGWDSAGRKSYYDIREATSPDGRVWLPEPGPSIELADGETNIANPAVLRDRDRWRMWYCNFVEGGYRIGYAESADGRRWTRLDSDAGIGLSESGWDSEGLAYPSVFSDAGRIYMLYSGNRYGRDGFGIATLVD